MAIQLFEDDGVGDVTFSDNKIVARFMNPTGFAMDDWIKVSFPADASISFNAEMTVVTDTGLTFRAVKAKNIGSKGVLYYVRCKLGPNQSVLGELSTTPCPGQIPIFATSNWVFEPGRPLSEVLATLIPGVQIKIDANEWNLASTEMQPTLVNSSTAHQEWKLQTRVGTSGFVFTAFLTIRHLSDVIESDFLIAWSDSTNPYHNLDGDITVYIKTGEYTKMNFYESNGHAHPIFNPADNLWYHQVLQPSGENYSTGLADGQGIAMFGHMLTSDQTYVSNELRVDYDQTADTPAQADLDIQERKENLQAYYTDTPCAVCLGWNGSWLALGWVPRIGTLAASPGGIGHPETFYDSFQDIFNDEAKGGLFSHRPLGSVPAAQSAGSQEDFSSCKGTFAVTYGDPRWINIAYYSIQGDFLRGYLHYETDGSQVLYADHPQWKTFQGITFYRVNPADMLGKSRLIPGTQTQQSLINNKLWTGYSESHRSGNNLAALLLLTGNSLIEHQLSHVCQSDGAMPKSFIGQTRAAGRLMHWWANFRQLLSDESNQLTLIDTVMAEELSTVQSQWRGGTHANTVKVIKSYFDTRNAITNGAGVDLEAWSVWEHSIACIGYYAAFKSTSDNAYKVILLGILEAIIEEAWFQEDYAGSGLKWWVCQRMWYPLGADEGRQIEAVQAGTRTVASTYTLVGPRYAGHAQGLSGTSRWITPAVLIAVELFAAGTSVGDKARLISAAITGGVEADNISDSEWWSCVESISF